LGNTLLFFDNEYFYEGVSKLEKKLKIAQLKKFISKRKLYAKLETSRINHNRFFKILKRKFKLKIGFRDFISLYCNIFWENRPALNYMESLYESGKYRIFILSNTDSMRMHFINRNFPQVNLIKHKILSFRIGMLKPSRTIYRYMMKKYNIKPIETLYIDDLKDNVMSAKSLGWNALRYTNYKSFAKSVKAILKKG